MDYPELSALDKAIVHYTKKLVAYKLTGSFEVGRAVWQSQPFLKLSRYYAPKVKNYLSKLAQGIQPSMADLVAIM